MYLTGLSTVAALIYLGSVMIRPEAILTSGTLLTNNLTFVIMLLGTVLLVGALAFMPAAVLGPIADHLRVPSR